MPKLMNEKFLCRGLIWWRRGCKGKREREGGERERERGGRERGGGEGGREGREGKIRNNFAQKQIDLAYREVWRSGIVLYALSSWRKQINRYEKVITKAFSSGGVGISRPVYDKLAFRNCSSTVLLPRILDLQGSEKMEGGREGGGGGERERGRSSSWMQKKLLSFRHNQR